MEWTTLRNENPSNQSMDYSLSDWSDWMVTKTTKELIKRVD